jgi:hypothetical protein
LKDGPVLIEGEPVVRDLTWVVAEDGRSHPDLALSATFVLLRLSVQHYVSLATGAMGPVENADSTPERREVGF